MQKKLTIAAVILALAAICLSIVTMCFTLKPADADSSEIQYVMYLGTNDKDTNTPVCGEEDAMEKTKEILIRHFGGYTIQSANGGWVDDDGTTYQEYTIVIFLSDTTIEAVHSAADELIQAFNQSSVLIQANETSTEFYSGGN